MVLKLVMMNILRLKSWLVMSTGKDPGSWDWFKDDKNISLSSNNGNKYTNRTKAEV